VLRKEGLLAEVGYELYGRLYMVYGIHDLVRAYIRARMDEDPAERDQAIDRLMDYSRYTTTSQSLRTSDQRTAHSDGEHVFISYVSEDRETVDKLQHDLEKAGITVWRDRSSLGPGDLWKSSIRRAIASGTFFIGCFSTASRRRAKSYMNEELTLAIEELRVRDRARVWFLPVVLPGGEVPDRLIGAGETLRDFNYIVLSPETWPTGVRRLVRAIKGDRS
jgi:TIR domain